MTDSAPQPLYLVDSSAFMDWQARFYPVDVFKSILDRVEALIAAKRFMAPALVKEELAVVGTGDLIAWADGRSMFQLAGTDATRELDALNWKLDSRFLAACRT